MRTGVREGASISLGKPGEGTMQTTTREFMNPRGQHSIGVLHPPARASVEVEA